MISKSNISRITTAVIKMDVVVSFHLWYWVKYKPS